MYEEREIYLLDLLDIERRISDAGTNLPCGNGADANGTDGGLCQILRQTRQLAEAFGGEEVRPGSLHPPTPEHIRRKAAIEDRLDRILPSTRDDR